MYVDTEYISLLNIYASIILFICLFGVLMSLSTLYKPYQEGYFGGQGKPVQTVCQVSVL